MLLDDISVYTRLESALFGAMSQACAVTGRAIGADVVAMRLFGVPREFPTSIVEVRHLDLPQEAEEALESWPESADGIMEFARKHQLCDRGFRPHRRPEEADGLRPDLFRPFEQAHRRVADAYCITFELDAGASGMAIYLRCETKPPFDERDLAALERLKPAIARLVREGLHRELQARGLESDPALTRPPQEPAVMLARLSRTERQILQYLRSNATERQIGAYIHRSPHTVHVHVKNIYRKLNVNSRRQLQELFGKTD